VPPTVPDIAHRIDSRGWFRSADGRRYGREIALLLVLKLVLLLALWAVAVKPATRADTSPAALAQHLSDGSAGSAPRRAGTDRSP